MQRAHGGVGCSGPSRSWEVLEVSVESRGTQSLPRKEGRAQIDQLQDLWAFTLLGLSTIEEEVLSSPKSQTRRNLDGDAHPAWAVVPFHIRITWERLPIPGPLSPIFWFNWSELDLGTGMCKSPQVILMCRQSWAPLNRPVGTHQLGNSYLTLCLNVLICPEGCCWGTEAPQCRSTLCLPFFSSSQAFHSLQITVPLPGVPPSHLPPHILSVMLWFLWAPISAKWQRLLIA